MPKKEGCLFRLCDFETFNIGGKMKKLKTLMSLTIGLAIGLGFVGKANAADCWVATAANGGDDSDTGADSSHAVLTIGKALTVATTSGDSIHVTGGTYTPATADPLVVITIVSLTLHSTGGAAACTIDATNGGTAIAVDNLATGVTIDGFTVVNIEDRGFETIETGTVIKNNIIIGEDHSGTWWPAMGVNVAGATDNATVSGNILNNCGASGINLDGGVNNSTIENNTIAGTAVYSGLTFVGNNDDNIVRGNTITGSVLEAGIYFYTTGSDDNLIENNILSDNNTHGIWIAGSITVTGLIITGNDITNNTEDGIKIESWTTASDSIYSNNIFGNGNYGIENTSGNGAYAENNWWGTTTGPNQATTNIHGTGNEVTSNVTYVPWLDASGGNATGGIPATLLLSASEDSVVVGGNTSLITTTLTDAIGNPIADSTIDYGVTTGDGTLLPASGTTDSWGQDTTRFSSPTLAAINTVTGYYRPDSSITASVNIAVTHGPLARVETTPVDTHAVVVGDVNIVAELMDTYRNHIDAADASEVSFTATGGSIGPRSVISDKIQMVYTTCDSIVAHTITATTATGSYTDITDVTTYGDAPATMTFTAEAGSTVVVSDTTNPELLSIALLDEYDNPSVYSDYYANKKYDVIFTWSAGAGIVDPDTVPVDVNGECTTDYKSSTVIGDYTVTATSGDANKSLDITQTVGALAAVSLTPDTATIAAGQGVTLIAELLDQFENHRKAADTTAVSFTETGLGVLGARGLTSDSCVTVVYTACNTAADTASIEANASGFKDTSIVINTAPNALDHFALSVSDTMPTAGHEVTITITAEDVGNFRIYTYDNDDIIALTLDGTAAEASQVRWIIPTTPPDTVLALTASIPESLFTDGEVAFEVLNKKAEAVTVTAVDIAEITGTTDTITWTPVDTLDHYGVVVQTDPIYGNFEFTITVNPCDKYGNVTTAELPRVLKFQANETGVTLSGDPLPCDRILEGPTDYTDMIADHATDSLVITVADYATPAIIGCSDTITVGGERDVGPTIVLSPPDTVYIDSTYNVIVRCENFRDEGENPKVECIITGEGSAYADTQYAILPFGGTDDVTFADWTVPPDAKGTFTITVVTLLSSDANPGNDTLIAQIVSRAYGVEEDRVTIPTRFEFLSIFPNPVSCNAKITYAIPVKSRIDMKIYDITGKLVTTLKNGVIEEPGYKVANWNMTDARGKKVNSGIYFCNLEMNKESSTKKILVIK